jgi:hypothetical protein
MRGFRLNGWQRIGIVLSVVWAVGASIYVRDAAEDRAEEFARSDYQICFDNARRVLGDESAECARNEGREDEPGRMPCPSAQSHYDAALNGCYAKLEQTRAMWLVGSWGDAAISALLPIPVAWLLVWGLVGLVRWIRRGFQASV